MHISQEQTDRDQLRMLAIFHFVLGGFSTFGFSCLVLHRFMMRAVFTNPQLANNPSGPLPPEVLIVMDLVYWVLGGLIVVQVVMSLLSGFFLWQRRHRLFSMVVAGLNRLNLPLGTVLGVFTLVVLMRESVAAAYTHTTFPAQR